MSIDKQCTPAHCGARRLTVENCVGEIELGDRLSSREVGIAVPTAITLRNNDRSAKRWPQCDDVTEAVFGGGDGTARKLLPSQVGRDAN